MPPFSHNVPAEKEAPGVMRPNVHASVNRITGL
jgi:hypothetical protein